MKNFISLLIKISISIGLLFFLFTRIDLHKTIYCIKTVNPLDFTFAIIIFLLVMFLGVFRWSILLNILNKNISFGRICVSYCGGLFFNVFLPSTIGGDIARTIDLSTHTKDGSSIFATVFLDRLCGFLALVLIAFFGYLYGYFSGLTRDVRFLLFMLPLALIVIFSFSVIFNKKVFNLVNKVIIFKSLKEYFTKFHNSCYCFRSQKVALLKTIFLSLLVQGLFSVTCYFIGRSLGFNLSVVYFLILIPIINTISFLPISIGGLGLRDNIAVVLFSTLGVASDKVAAMTLLMFTFLFSIGIMGGIVYGATFYSRRLQRN
ncbi:MAG: lysylphosphatidylglycerol synthase transmembrane domain-containing protein [Candidatus Omnitrophota bacterium]